MIEPHCLTIAPMLRGACFRPLSRADENGFVGGQKWFRPNRPRGGAAVENSGKPVNSCAASVWETEWIPALEAVDMLRTDVPIHRRGSPRPRPRPSWRYGGIAEPSPAKGKDPAPIELEYRGAKKRYRAAVEAAKDWKNGLAWLVRPVDGGGVGTKPFRRADETILKPAWAIRPSQ
jgi:hypothetical protein